jgi:hypothetical protein
VSLGREAPQEDPRIVALRRRFPEGSRVRLTADVERYPHFIARKGSEGTVTHNTDGGIEVKLDDHLPGAEPWDNEVVWVDADLIWEGYPDGWHEPELKVIARPPSFAVKFEESMPDGEPVAFVTGILAQGAYVVEPVSYGEDGEADETAWVLSGHKEHDDPERAEPWLDAALTALSAAWWMRLEDMREAESAAGWDPTP